jgi:hypothetical protein
MKTITLSDLDAQLIVEALRLRNAVLCNQLLTLPEEPTPELPSTPKYGVKKDGTPRKPPGRPRTKK